MSRTTITFDDPEKHWCPKRKRFIPPELVGTDPPKASDGLGWAGRQKYEDDLLAAFDAKVKRLREHFRLDVQGMLNPRDADPRNRR